MRSFRWGGRIVPKARMLKPYRHPKTKRVHSRKLYVKLTRPDGKMKCHSVIGLMALVWLGGVPAGMVPYHKNGVSDDNAANNIGFIKIADLNRHQIGTGRKPVAQINILGEVVNYYPSLYAAGKANYLSTQAVLDRCKLRVEDEFLPDGTTFRYAD